MARLPGDTSKGTTSALERPGAGRSTASIDAVVPAARKRLTLSAVLDEVRARFALRWSPDAPARLRAVAILANRGARAALLRALDDTHEPVRELAALGLLQSGWRPRTTAERRQIRLACHVTDDAVDDGPVASASRAPTMIAAPDTTPLDLLILERCPVPNRDTTRDGISRDQMLHHAVHSTDCRSAASALALRGDPRGVAWLLAVYWSCYRQHLLYDNYNAPAAITDALAALCDQSQIRRLPTESLWPLAMLSPINYYIGQGRHLRSAGSNPDTVRQIQRAARRELCQRLLSA
jgi:hypothetical protein